MESDIGDVFTLQECAAYLKIAESSLYVLLRAGRIPCAKKVGRHWRIRKEALDKWLDGNNGEIAKPTKKK